MRRCKFGFHKWGNWITAKESDGSPGLWQGRFCQLCNRADYKKAKIR